MCARPRGAPGQVQRGSAVHARARPQVRSRESAPAGARGWAGVCQAWAGETTKDLSSESNYSPSRKVVGWQCPGCGLRSVGHPRAKKQNATKKTNNRVRERRNRSLSPPWWRNPTAVETSDPQVPRGRVRVGGLCNTGDLSPPPGELLLPVRTVVCVSSLGPVVFTLDTFHHESFERLADGGCDGDLKVFPVKEFDSHYLPD